MAIGLPPPQAPQMGVLDTLRNEASSGVEFSYDLYRVHVSGNDRIPVAEFKRRFRAAGNVSDAVRSIAALYYRAGYPLTQVLYAVSGRDLYIQISVRGVDKVDAPKALMPYLGGLAGDVPLTASKLEPRRLLANVAAQRAGIEGDLRIEEVGTEARPEYALVAPGDDRAWGTVHGNFGYGNVGNRYVGRDLADATLQVTTRYGDQFNLGAVSSVHGFGIGDSGGFYREVDGAYDRDTPYGLFSIRGRYAPFRQTIDGFQLRGTIKVASVSWLVPVYADFSKRLILQIHGLRSSFSEELVGHANPELDSELYTAVEGGPDYEQSLDDNGHWRFGASVLIGHGFGPHHAPGTAVALDYLLFRPSLKLTYSPDPRWTAELGVNGQYSDDSVPQTQQWVLGGFQHLAAYRAGVAVGDTGGLARLVVSRNDLAFSRFLFTPSVFAEYGLSRQMHAVPGGTRQPTQSLADAGGALTVKLGAHVSAQTSMAGSFLSHNLDREVQHGFRATYFFKLRASF